MSRIQKSAEICDERMNEILRSHVIEPETLRLNNFDAFFQAREQALLDRIEQAMGKPIAREVTEQENVEAIDYEYEEAA